MEIFLELPAWKTWLVVAPLFVTTLVAAITDAHDRTIPNRLTYPAVGVGLVVQMIALGWSGLGWGVATVLVVLAVGIACMLAGWMGGGDVKLLAAVGAFVGFQGLFEIFFYSVFVGAAMGLMIAAFDGYLWTLIRRIGTLLKGWIRQLLYQTRQVGEELERDERSEVPFGIAICMGTWLAYTEARTGWPGLWTWFAGHF